MLKRRWAADPVQETLDFEANAHPTVACLGVRPHPSRGASVRGRRLEELARGLGGG